MPIYEYECVPKGHRFEELQKLSDRPIAKCKVCGGKVRKLVSAPAFQLKGGGWYKDGYASVKPSESKSESNTEAKSESKSDTPAAKESKPETKSEAKTETKPEVKKEKKK